MPIDNALQRQRAAQLFGEGVAQAEVTRTLGVSRQTVSRWHARWRAGGEAALAAVGARGPRSRLTDSDVMAVDAALRRGPDAYGFPEDHWTCRQVGWLIARVTGVSYHPAHVCRLIRRHGWTVKPPSVGRGDRTQPSPF